MNQNNLFSASIFQDDAWRRFRESTYLFGNDDDNDSVETMLSSDSHFLFLLIENIFFCADIFGETNILIDASDNDDEINMTYAEVSEWLQREQIYADIRRTINAHETKWISYQTMSQQNATRETVSSVERI